MRILLPLDSLAISGLGQRIPGTDRRLEAGCSKARIKRCRDPAGFEGLHQISCCPRGREGRAHCPIGAAGAFARLIRACLPAGRDNGVGQVSLESWVEEKDLIRVC